MTIALELLVLAACLALAAAYSGGETAFHTVSRVRVDLGSRRGERGSRLVRRLLAQGPALSLTLALGLHLALLVLVWRATGLARAFGLSLVPIAVLLALLATPPILFFAVLLPKELFRRRPELGLRVAAPGFAFSRALLWPLERLVHALSLAIGGLLRLAPETLANVRGRETVLGFLREGARGGALPEHAAQLARNVLKLRSIEVARAMVPWKSVELLSSAASQAELYAQVGHSPRTRLPVVSPEGEVLGYVHQLDVLGDGPAVPVLEHLRELDELPLHLPVDRALARLRASGQRIAIVGRRAAPRGLVTLKDLVEEISGDLAGW